MSDGLVSILDGNTFVVSDVRGDIDATATDPTGLFSFDTRFLSRWVLTVDGQRLTALSTDDLQYFESQFFLVPSTGTVYVDSKLSVIRRRQVGDGFREDLTVLNHDASAVEAVIRIDAGADFADLFEVKDALKKKGTYGATMDDGRLVLTYDRDAFRRTTTISSTEPPEIDEHGLHFPRPDRPARFVEHAAAGGVGDVRPPRTRAAAARAGRRAPSGDARRPGALARRGAAARL